MGAYIDACVWKSNTSYEYCSSTDQAVVWFWQVLAELSQDDLANFLTFCTGSSQLPAPGFTIMGKLFDVDDSVIVAHTCLNRISLPMASSKDRIRQMVPICLDHVEFFSTA